MNKKKNDIDKQKIFCEILELNALEDKFKRIKKQYETKKNKLSVSIKNYMFANGENEINFKAENLADSSIINVKKVTPQKILWDIDKLEQQLDKELCNEIVTKKYNISDMQGLIKYLRSCGVNPKKFKSYLTVEKSINADTLNQLSEVGEIEKEDIEGCYTINKSSSYLRISVKKAEE
jgi:hypothetical protein